MQNIATEDMITKERVREFKQFRREVEAEAKAKGITIDMNKIVDEDTRLVQPYTKELVEEFSNLVQEVNYLKAQGNEKFTEYLLAKHKLDDFKYKHFEQELRSDYYKEKLAIEEAMLDDGIGKKPEIVLDDDPLAVDPFAGKKETDPLYKGHRYIFSYYKKLKNRQFELRGHVDSDGNLEEHWAKELEEVENELNRLTYNPNDFYGAGSEFDAIPDKEKDLEAYKRHLLYGGAHRAALNKYIQVMRELNQKYFKYDAIYGFDEELKRNLETIHAYEERTPSGELKTPMSELMKKEDYVKAKTWIAHNAKYIHSQDFWDDVKKQFKVINGGSSKDNTRNLVKNLAAKRDAVDSKGIIDARKLTEGDIADIKESQRKYYQYHQQNGTSDGKLIKNGNRDTTVYTSAFYKGMTGGGEITQEYNKLCMKINSILGKVYNPYTKTVRTDQLSTEDLKKLNEYYSKIRDIQKRAKLENGKAVRKFIEENVDFDISEENQKLFDTLNQWAKEKAEQLGEEWYKEWYDANTEVKRDTNGDPVLGPDGTVVIQPNSHLYGSIKPKAKVKDKFTDKAKTEALKNLRKLITFDKTEYYYQTVQEKLKEGKEAYQKWYDENHIYDPYRQQVVPLQCWTTMKPNDNVSEEYKGQWVPAYRNTRRTIKDGRDIFGNLDGSEDMRNSKFQPQGYYNNYKKGTGYDSNIVLNEYEQKVRNHFAEVLNALAKTESSKRFLRGGRMPVERKPGNSSVKSVFKEGVKFIGYVEANIGNEEFYNDGTINFTNDKTMDMPMLHMLEAKDGAKFDEKEPLPENYSDIDDYNKAKADYDKRKVEFKKVKQKEHNDAVNRDWWEVMAHFIEKAGHYNTIQDQKLLLYYGERMLRNYQVYKQNFGFGKLNEDKQLSTEDSKVYERAKDSNIHGQYVNWVRRLIYNQFKEKNNAFTRGANLLQNITSNTFMMMNVKGGIANILMGETQILGERFAKEYFGTKEWAKGKAIWGTNALSFIHGMGKETSISVADAIIKQFDVIDYDEITGQIKVAKAEERVQKLRDLMFSPQAIGEHFMQNGALFAMLESHRLFENPKYNEQSHAAKYVTKNLAEHIRDLADIELKKLLSPEYAKKFAELREQETKDANNKKEYVRFRRNLSTEFAIRYLTKEERKVWRKNYNKAVAEAKKDFEDDTKHPTLMSQFALAKDGMLGFKDDSLLSQIPVEERSRIIGIFKRRVISVNKKIHGNYGKMDQAQIEKTWYGSLLMQYHKHIFPGLMKHFRREGYYNEERGTIEKGCYVSLVDFLSLNMRAVKATNNMTEAQTTAMESIQNVLKGSVDFLLQVKDTYHSLPEYDKANIRRSLGEITMVLSALFLAVAARAILDDDDESFIGNLALYEADRLASESMQFNPIGIYAEAGKLWSKPIAATSGIEDLLSSAGQLCKMLLEGDNYDSKFHSGRFSGENKLTVYVKRRIPLYRQYDGLMHISDDNHYYKLTGNITGFSQPIYDAISK